jgi:predicted dehydrogenase
VGVYPLNWVFQTLYHTVPPSERQPPSVAAQMSFVPETGADENTAILLKFPNGPGDSAPHTAHGIALTGLRVGTDPDGKGNAGPAVRIQGTKGEIQVDHPAFRPTRFRVIEKGGNLREVEMDIPGQGMFWEADEAARCLRDGKLESENMSWAESILIMKVMDKARRQAGLEYPGAIESTDYPVHLPRKQ